MDQPRDPTRPRVLLVGLDPRRVPGPWDPEPVVRAVEDAVARLRADGADVTTCLVGLDGSDAVDDVVRRAVSARPWDCVLVGGGLRHDADLLPTFELVVNLVHHHAPGAAIAFDARPGDAPEAVRRALALPRPGNTDDRSRD